MKIDLLIIDPQNSFCDPSEGELFVKGADEDMIRLAKMITRSKDKINNIRVTLDSHHFIHIAHPIWWQDKDGNSPTPFTIITSKDVSGENPVLKARNSVFAKRSVDYINQLEIAGKVLCIWPPHCLIGSKGHAIFEPLFNALIEWEGTQFNIVDKIVKGMNIFTEQYSALKSEIQDKDDPDTQLNQNLIDKLKDADKILIAGEALNFCVAESVRDIIQHIRPNKLVILTDAMSSVNGFEKLSEYFLAEIKMKGLILAETTSYNFNE